MQLYGDTQHAQRCKREVGAHPDPVRRGWAEPEPAKPNRWEGARKAERRRPRHNQEPFILGTVAQAVRGSQGKGSGANGHQ